MSGETDVLSTTKIYLWFNKEVTVSDGWFTLSCDDGMSGPSKEVSGLTSCARS